MRNDLMNQADSKVQIRPDSATPGVRGSHAHLLERLTILEPYRFDARHLASGDELDLAASVLRTTITAFEQYLVAAVQDAAAHTNAVDTDIFRSIRYTLDDLQKDVGGAIERAADTVREEHRYSRGRAA
jgi:hypothetical protein